METRAPEQGSKGIVVRLVAATIAAIGLLAMGTSVREADAHESNPRFRGPGQPHSPPQSHPGPGHGCGGAGGGGTGGGDGGGAARPVGIDTGSLHSCALFSDGSARCWGYNDYGQLGNGATGPSSCAINGINLQCSPTPVPVVNLAGATSISIGDYDTCARLSDGSVQCWGVNENGELGLGTATGPETCTVTGVGLACSTRPVSVPGLTNVTSISTSAEEHSCASLADGSVKCWGLEAGQFGTTPTTGLFISPQGLPYVPSPVAVPNLAGVSAVETASFHSCALLWDSTVSCWGDNLSGELGVGTSENDVFPPATVPGLTGSTAIAVGGQHTCALLPDRSVRCWGNNAWGQLGTGTSTSCLLTAVFPPIEIPCDTTPTPVPGLAGATAIAAGGTHTCALLDDTSVRCWGRNDNGQLGIGTTSGPSGCSYNGGAPVACAPTPVAVPNLTGVVAIAAGDRHTCALLADSSVRCWGYNVFGQLGDGTTTDSPTPVTVVWQ